MPQYVAAGLMALDLLLLLESLFVRNDKFESAALLLLLVGQVHDF